MLSESIARSSPGLLGVCCRQLVDSIICLLAVNVAGALTAQPRELAQRRAFLETRNCIEERLVIQRDNQQQVRKLLLIFLLPCCK